MTVQVRYLVLALMALTHSVLYITRVSLSVVIVSMTIERAANSSSELKNNVCPAPASHFANSSKGSSSATAPRYDWTQSTRGLILGSFFYPYVLLQVPAGLFAETFGGKWPICMGILFSALLDFLTPLVAYSANFFVLVRILLGIVQCGIYCSAYGMLHKWFPEAQRSTAYAILRIGGVVGNIITNSMEGALCEYGFSGGWPSVFYVSGFVGVAYFLIAAPFLTSRPSEHKWVTKAELSLINADREIGGEKKMKSRPKVPWLQILTSKRVLVLLFANFASGLSSAMVSQKLPTYLGEILHISPTENGLINALQYAMQFLTLFSAGPLSELIIKKNWLSKTSTRKVFLSIDYSGVGICTMLIPFMGCSEAGIGSLMLSINFLQGLGVGGGGPMPGEMTMHFPAILVALVNAFEMSTSFVSPSIAGWVLDTSGDDIMSQWKVLFVMSGCLTISGALVFGLFAEAKRLPCDIELDKEVDSSRDDRRRHDD